MTSHIRINKSCLNCGKQFVAKTTVTKYCGAVCAKKAYKKRKRDERLNNAVALSLTDGYSEFLKIKEFFSIKESSMLLGLSRWTLYRLIRNGDLKVSKIGSRVIVKRSELEKLML